MTQVPKAINNESPAPINQGIVVSGNGKDGHIGTQPALDFANSPFMNALQEATKRKEEIRKDNLALCCQIFCFAAFLFFFTLAMLLEQSASSSQFADHVRDMVAGGGPNHHAYMVLDRISTTDDMYDFLEDTFIPAFWQNNTDTEQALQRTTKLHPIDSTNRLLGSARIRQVRVAKDPACQVGPMFETYTIPCYPSSVPPGLLADGNEDTESYGPDGVYAYATDPFGNGYTGSLGAYGEAGYMEYLATNVTMATIAVQGLRAGKFFDYATRAVFVDFTIWNSNFGTYAVSRIAVEFGPAGTTAKYLELSVLTEQTLSVGGRGAFWDWMAFIFLLILMCFVIYYLAEEIQEIIKQRCGYFTDGWNILDWINMIVLIVAFTLRCMVWAEAGDLSIGTAQLANRNSYTSIRGLASKSEWVRLLNAFNAVLLWGKFVKYSRHLPIVKQLVKTVWNAFGLFLPFMLMFSVVLIGFTMSYNLGFGDKMRELSGFTRAVVYLCRAFIKDITLMPVYHITPIFGAALILLFYVMVVLVGVNVLFAIMADAMFRAKCHPEDNEPDPEHHDEPLEEFWRTLKGYLVVCFLKCCCPTCRKWVVQKIWQKVVEKTQEVVGDAIGKGMEAIGDDNEKMALKDGTMSESTYSGGTVHREATCTYPEMMLAIQHMAGRVLSEVQEVGIEIKSELHDVCERVAQMQMAVEELSWRAELVRREQEIVPGVSEPETMNKTQ